MSTNRTDKVRGIARSAFAFVTLAIVSAASAEDIRTTVNGDLVNFPDIQPVMMQNRVMVPVRGVFEHLDSNVTLDSETRTVIAHRGNDHIRLPINSRYAMVNGEQVLMDTPARIYAGRTMVPLRFLSEALGASVEWSEDTRTVGILTTTSQNTPPQPAGFTLVRMESNTVIPFRLNDELSSNRSRVGDRFTASLDTMDAANYEGMEPGSTIEGHVDIARAKSGTTPGVLGLKFDRLRLANGKTIPVYGTLIGLDKNSVTNEGGRLTAKTQAKNSNLKFVGYGAGTGAIIAMLTKGNVVSNTLIGSALGYLYGELKKDPSKSNDVKLGDGAKFGVRLTRDLSFPVNALARK